MPDPADLLPDVSRETLAALQRYVTLLEKWNAKINLVGRGTQPNIWSRHIADSAQLFELAPNAARWVDFGSGGGLPAVVVAILSKENLTDRDMVCVDSDQRKCAFLRIVAQELGLRIAVHAQRIESLKAAPADVISARALAPLPQLLHLAAPNLRNNGTCLFLKGKSWREEVEAARRSWHFSCEAVRSTTSSEAVILKIGELGRVQTD